MQSLLVILLSVLLLLSGCVQARNSQPAQAGQDLRALEQALRSNQRDTTGALTDPTLLYLHSNPRFRELIRQYAVSGKTRLVAPNESGEPLIVSGIVRDNDGKPLAGGLLHIYQTDARGYYTPERAMDEPHARLFAYLRTGSDGGFEFRTIRPGGYPQAMIIDGEERKIPAHVHVDVTAPRYQMRRFQLVFADDPLLKTLYWQEWAKRYGFPVLVVEKDPDGILRGVCDLTLTKL